MVHVPPSSVLSPGLLQLAAGLAVDREAACHGYVPCGGYGAPGRRQ